MRKRQYGGQMEVPADRRRWLRRGRALAAAGVIALLAGCGTANAGERIASGAAFSDPRSAAAVSESAAEEKPARGAAESGDQVLWTEESVPSPGELAASAVPQAEAGGVKEQTEEFLEGVQGLMGHLNDTYHSVHSNP